MSLPHPQRAVIDTARRLGPCPDLGHVGWRSWQDEAAALLCWRLAKKGHRNRTPPCRGCLDVMEAMLRRPKVNRPIPPPPRAVTPVP